jgi:hypothetical protein
LSHLFLSGEVSPRACSGALACCTGMAHCRAQHTLRGNNMYFLSHACGESQQEGSLRDKKAAFCEKGCPHKQTLFQCREQAKWQKADSTLRSSQAVPHPSTNRALRRLTSEVRRDPVYSTRYGRQRGKRKENRCTRRRTFGLGSQRQHRSKKTESCQLPTPEVTALHSGLRSHHCK